VKTESAVFNETICIQDIRIIVAPIYEKSIHYTLTIHSHIQRVAGNSKKFAEQLELNPFIAEAAGLLHDIGAAIHGKHDHHITGVKEATPILYELGIPLEQRLAILECILTHRGSRRIEAKTPEAVCVASADAWDHFINLRELWRVQIKDRKKPLVDVYNILFDKLNRSWQKIDERLKPALEAGYRNALIQLKEIAAENGQPV
jgi:putative nucleotidyltransferase with HDIG domain